MSQFNDRNGGPAFPQPHLDMGGASGAVSADEMGAGGMSLHDYFAGRALAGLCANPNVFASNSQFGWGLVNCTDDQLVEYARDLASAMLIARAA